MEEMKQVVRELVTCPIHVTNVLKARPTKKSGRVFFTCPEKTCPVFCFENKLRDYCTSLTSKLLPLYKCFTPLCQCDRPTTLKVSGSEKNPQRPYFSCKSDEQCKFFQWGDEELSDKNFQLAMELEQKKQMQKAAKEQFLYKLGNQTPAPIMTDKEIEDLLACIRNPEAQMYSNLPVQGRPVWQVDTV